ncbi:MAG: hypothetical protein AAGF12_34615 [Myxococcota bacterium]
MSGSDSAPSRKDGSNLAWSPLLLPSLIVLCALVLGGGVALLEWLQVPAFVTVLFVLLAPFLMLAGVMKVAPTILRSRVRVGVDGVFFGKRIAAAPRFVSYGDVREVGEDGGTVWLRRENGEKLEIASLETHPRLLERLQAALDAFRAQDALDTVAALQPRDESVTEWRARLARASAARYREQSLPRETLFEAVEDPSASLAVRVGALVALGDTTPSERERVARAANATVAPKVRVALETLAGDEVSEEELVEVLSKAHPQKA